MFENENNRTKRVNLGSLRDLKVIKKFTFKKSDRSI